MKTLRDVKIGETAKVKKLQRGKARSNAGSWIWELPKELRCMSRKVAPLGDPVELTVRNYELSLRKEDAAMVEVE